MGRANLLSPFIVRSLIECTKCQRVVSVRMCVHSFSHLTGKRYFIEPVKGLRGKKSLRGREGKKFHLPVEGPGLCVIALCLKAQGEEFGKKNGTLGSAKGAEGGGERKH